MLILDTHTLLWFLRDSSELSLKTKNMIQQADIVSVSIVSLWEIAIKISLGKLELDVSISEIENLCYEKDILILPIKTKELEILNTLPKLHGDPFDRLIICQTIQSSAILITKDTIIPKYPVRTYWE